MRNKSWSYIRKKKKICTRHPEDFATEEIARFDVSWADESNEELKVSIEEKEEIKLSTNWLVPKNLF